MYKKTITYTDYDGNERKEDFWFNLTKAELTKMNLSEVGGMKARLERIIATMDIPQISKVFEDIIHRSYGVKSPDGRQFIKNEELVTAFEQTEAYSQLFMEITTDANAAAEFAAGILPADLADAARKEQAKLLKEDAPLGLIN